MAALTEKHIVEGRQYLYEPGFFFERHGDELLLGVGKWHYYD